jgi:protein-S-isoprenylcysteine O-methyltransferase Ste14
MITDLKKGRIFAILQFILIAIILYLSYINESEIHTYLLFRIVGMILILLGIIIGIIAFINFNQIITPNPVPLPTSKLSTKGIYKFIRHPMYLFGIVISVGWCIYFYSFISAILIVLLIIFFIIKINFEEKQLLRKFPEYSEYRDHSYKLLPFIY